MADELFEIRNALQIGAFQTCINEAEKLSVSASPHPGSTTHRSPQPQQGLPCVFTPNRSSFALLLGGLDPDRPKPFVLDSERMRYG